MLHKVLPHKKETLPTARGSVSFLSFNRSCAKYGGNLIARGQQHCTELAHAFI